MKSVEVAIAILYQEHRLLLQLRDDLPHILYPGHWGLFGGHLETGETPEEAVVREVLEEINYTLPSYEKFCTFPTENVQRHIFSAPLTVSLDQLTLNEGADFALISAEEIAQGACYSPRLQCYRPLGYPHQTILLNFLNSYLPSLRGQ